jgi:hypothetical protein
MSVFCGHLSRSKASFFPFNLPAEKTSMRLCEPKRKILFSNLLRPGWRPPGILLLVPAVLNNK